MLNVVTANLSGLVRHDQMEGRDFLVAPMIMLTEGVHQGSAGPILYTAEELGKIPAVWNHKPVVVYHPTKNGSGISACSPTVITNRKVGVIMNTTFEDGKLKAEAWLDPERMDIVDERIGIAVENGDMMELSTGLFVDEDKKSGVWNEENYVSVARNFRPDHLALLPDLKGACSIEDGAGFLRLNINEDNLVLVNNQISHGNIRSMLNSYLFETRPDAWIEDVFDSFFIFSEGGSFFKQSFEIVDNQLEVSLNTEQVVRITEWRSLDGTFVGNKNSRKENAMTKVQIVESLIGNASTHWTEEDKEALMKMNKDLLSKMLPIVNEDDTTEAETTEAETPEADETPEVETPEANQAKTPEQYIANAPKAIAGMLKHGMEAYKAQKAKLVETIMNDDRNVFTEVALNLKEIDELTAISQLVSNELEQESSQTTQLFNFQGQGNAVRVPKVTETPMVAPGLDFSTQKTA